LSIFISSLFSSISFRLTWKKNVHMVAQLVEVLCYKPEGHGFDSQWRHWSFPLTYSFWTHYGSASTERVTEMSTKNISWGVKVAWCFGLTTLPLSWANYLANL
jgi:hypothetical protein